MKLLQKASNRSCAEGTLPKHCHGPAFRAYFSDLFSSKNPHTLSLRCLTLSLIETSYIVIGSANASWRGAKNGLEAYFKDVHTLPHTQVGLRPLCA